MPAYKKRYGIHQLSKQYLNGRKSISSGRTPLPIEELKKYDYSVRMYSCDNIVFDAYVTDGGDYKIMPIQGYVDQNFKSIFIDLLNSDFVIHYIEKDDTYGNNPKELVIDEGSVS